MKKTILLIIGLLVIINLVYSSESKSFSYTINFSESNKNFSINFTTPDSITSISFLGNLSAKFGLYDNSTLLDLTTTTGETINSISHNATHIIASTNDNNRALILIKKNTTTVEQSWNLTWIPTVNIREIILENGTLLILNSTAGTKRTEVVRVNLSTNPAEIIDSYVLAFNNQQLRTITKVNDTAYWISGQITADYPNVVLAEYNLSFYNYANHSLTGMVLDTNPTLGPISMTIINEELWVIGRPSTPSNIVWVYNTSSPYKNIRNETLQSNIVVGTQNTFSYIDNSLYGHLTVDGAKKLVELGGKPYDIKFYINDVIQYRNDKYFSNISNEDFNATILNDQYLCSNLDLSNQCDFTANFESRTKGVLDITLNLTYLPYHILYSTEKTLETSLQDFDISIANLTNSTAIDIALFYNGTFFNPTSTTTYPSNTAFNYSFNIPKIDYPDNAYNFSFYFEYNHTYPTGDESRTSETLNQTVFQVIIDNCTKATMGTLNVTIHNESDDIILDGTINYVVDYWLASYQNLAQNVSGTMTDNGTFCIYPNWTSVVSNILFDYTVDGTTYEYSAFEMILNNITQQIILYATDGTTQITFSVRDTRDNPIENAYIKIMKYDIDSNTFKTVELLRTNNDGEAVGNLVTFTEWYKFIIEYNGIVYLSTESTKVFATTKNFIIDLEADDWFGNYDITTGVTTSLIFNNVSKNFVFTWSDPNAAMHYGCLKVVKRSAAGDTLIDDQCIESTASTIIINIGSADSGRYIATGFLKFDSLIPVEVLEKLFSTDRTLYKKGGAREIGLFASWMFSISLAFVGVWNPAVSIFLLLIGLLTTSVLQLWQIATPMLITIILLGAIILFRMGRK